MTPEQRKAIVNAAIEALGHGMPHMLAEDFDKLTRAGFVISHPAVRDHTGCELCAGTGTEAYQTPEGFINREPYTRVPCRGGSPVVWSTEP